MRKEGEGRRVGKLTLPLVDEEGGRREGGR